MHKTMNNDPMQSHKAQAAFFRTFAKGVFLLLMILILLGVGAEVMAQDLSTTERTENVIWPVIVILAAGAAFYCIEWKMPCYQWRKEHETAKAGVKPTKPWNDYIGPDTFPELDIPLADSQISEELINQILKRPSAEIETLAYTKLDALYPAYRTRATDDPNFVERRKTDQKAHGNTSHKDDHAVLMFSFSMKERLSAARQKHEHYDHHNTAAVSVEDLEKALLVAMRRGNVVDIANHCMFLDARGIRNIKTGVRE